MRSLQIFLNSQKTKMRSFFSKLVVQEFGDEHLNRCPTQEEKQRAMRLMAARGFPGCFSSWDCKYFVWKNYPVRLAGQTQGKGGASSVVPGRHPSTSQLLCDTP
jgi:hypothetical protein